MARIPKTLHLVFGMGADFGGKPWSLIHHVCLLSAVQRLRPDKVLFHYSFEPSGPWWRLSRPLVTLNRVTAPDSVFGNPLNHVAHKADVIRMQVLIEHGGIYLDTDVLVQRSFDDLLDHSVVMGQEKAGGSIGMANAVILAEPQAPYLRRWYEEFRSFNDRYWNEHSVMLPARLAAAHPDEVTVLPPNAFFWPTWEPDDLALLIKSPVELPLHETYANHLWESKIWWDVRDMTPGDVRRGEGNFQRWAAPLLTGLPDRYGAPSLLFRARRGGRRRLFEFYAKLQHTFALQS